MFPSQDVPPRTPAVMKYVTPRRLMARTRKETTTPAQAMTPAAIQNLVADSITAALETQAATIARSSRNNRATAESEASTSRKCTYKDFMSCQPTYFKGSEGVTELAQWFKLSVCDEIDKHCNSVLESLIEALTRDFVRLATRHESETISESVISSLNDEIDFRVSFDDSDDEDYTVIFDKNSFSSKIISSNDLKTDLENDNEKVNLPSHPSPKPTVSCFDDLDFFKDFENEFPAIVYNDAQTSKSDLLTKPILSPQHIDEFDLNDETSLSEYDEEEQNNLYLMIFSPSTLFILMI
ncbi:hypothetical protein Tco_1304504 [Tanacetum coccineum]